MKDQEKKDWFKRSKMVRKKIEFKSSSSLTKEERLTLLMKLRLESLFETNPIREKQIEMLIEALRNQEDSSEE